MCTTVRTLAEAYGPYQITKCSCGIIHLTWGRMTLHLQPTEFRKIAIFLISAHEQTILSGEKLYHIKECGVMFSADNNCQLWLLGTGYHLTRDKFVRLCQLVQTAYQELEDERPDIDALSTQIESWLAESAV